jgi:aminopeptidase N
MYQLAQTAGGYGMESPGLTWIPGGARSLGYLVAHETAHQWFYGIVGNDQARRPFADEAAADFVARYALGLKRGSRCSAQTLDRSIYRYTALCYYEVIYIQGGNVLDSLRQRMGSTRFWGAIRRYLGDHRFGLSSTKTLLDALDAATPLSFSATYRSRFPSLY